MICERITGKDYEKCGADPIVNHDKIIAKLGYIYNSSLRKASNMRNIHLLHKDNVEQFKTYWGKQSCTWVGFGRFWIWKHEFGNCDLYALSCPSRGASYEVKITGHEDAAAIEVASFYKKLLNNLRIDNKELK